VDAVVLGALEVDVLDVLDVLDALDPTMPFRAPEFPVAPTYAR
jgi:hypothetical protein